MERINSIFGNDWITDIKFVASELSEAPIMYKKPISPLTGSEKKYLSSVLDGIEDPEIKKKLESLGKAILMEVK